MDFKLPYEYKSAKTVSIVPISKIRGSAQTTNHETSTVIAGCLKGFNLPILQSTQRYLKLFGPEVQAKLEEDLGLEKNTLTFTSADPSKGVKYWNRQTVYLDKSGKKFDLSDPMDYIHFAIMYAQNSVAKTFADIKKKTGEYEFYFLDEEEKARTENTSIKERAKASAKAFELTESTSKMIKFLKVHTGKAPDKAWGVDKLENAVLNLSTQNPKEFLKTIEDEDYEIKLLIAEAVQTKNLIVEGKNYNQGYRLGWSDTKDYIATNKNEMVAWLKNPANNKAKLLIESKTREALGESEK
tara:strand:+ start:3922 stop:4815 length:894 start_codon:yes stop_codon:yes gene_type:complete